MDNSYFFFIILKFRRLSEASSSRPIRRISGDNEFNSIYPNGIGYVHIVHIWIVCYTPALYARVLCGATFKVGAEGGRRASCGRMAGNPNVQSMHAHYF